MAIGWGFEAPSIGWFATAVIHQFSESELHGINDCEAEGRNWNSVICTRPLIFLVSWRSLNWRNGWGRENSFVVDCWDGCKRYRSRRCYWGLYGWFLQTSKGEIGRWNLTKKEKRFFGGDCIIASMHNWGCENEGALTILERIPHALY